MRAYVAEMTWIRFAAIVIAVLIILAMLVVLAGIGIYHALIESTK